MLDDAEVSYNRPFYTRLERVITAIAGIFMIAILGMLVFSNVIDSNLIHFCRRQLSTEVPCSD